MMPNIKHPKSSSFSFSYFLGTAIDILMPLIVGVGIGYGTDKHFDLSPWGVLIGFFMGLGACGLNLWRWVIKNKI